MWDKEFLDIEVTIECRFTQKLVRDMIVTYSQCSAFFIIMFYINTSVIMTAIPTARQSKINCINTHLKHCSRLINSFETILFGEFLTTS